MTTATTCTTAFKLVATEVRFLAAPSPPRHTVASLLTHHPALHFHLSIATTGVDGAAASYDDAEFLYLPLLDENRDRDLLAILPDYLTEEICFPRCHAARFYSKVVECMTKKVEMDE